MRATGSFTIKQCNRVADAWSVVCGPRGAGEGERAPVPPLSFHSFHYSTTTPRRCPHHLEVLFGCSFPPFCFSFPFAHPAHRDSLRSTLDSKMVTHLPIGYYDPSGIPRRRSFPTVIIESPERTTRLASDSDKKFFTKSLSLKVKRR